MLQTNELHDLSIRGHETDLNHKTKKRERETKV